MGEILLRGAEKKKSTGVRSKTGWKSEWDTERVSARGVFFSCRAPGSRADSGQFRAALSRKRTDSDFGAFIQVDDARIRDFPAECLHIPCCW